MVQLMKSGELAGDRDTTPCRDKVPVKLEIVEDSVEEEHGPRIKRSKASGNSDQQWGAGANAFTMPPAQYNPLDEPSPLGLRLRKSPSLLDLIQMRLSQGNASNLGAAHDGISGAGAKKDSKGASTSNTVDKLKASNFPASLLRIGRWEYKSRYEGDLVAKCYFAKHKLVWEVLDGSLKSKIEIQWSDIMALKANCPDNGPGMLNVVLGRQPLFYRETNPQPRKHTLWQATADFTDGQASIHRQHFLQCPQGLLNKHFEKLIQCDLRLNLLSQQPHMVLDSPFFEPRPSIFEDPEEPKGHDINYLENEKKPGVAAPQVLPAVPSSSLKIEQQDPSGLTSEHLGLEAPSPSSVMDTHAMDGNGKSNVGSMKGMRNWEQMKVPGLHPSISMSDFMNHIGQCITEQIASDDPSKDSSACQDVLEDIAQYLLTDNQLTQASDEKSLMARVNSLCCLLQKDPSMLNLQAAGESCSEKPSEAPHSLFTCTTESAPVTSSELKVSEGDRNEGSKSKQPAGMSRKDSFGELLMHLPRIASLPKFLFNISEEESDNNS